MRDLLKRRGTFKVSRIMMDTDPSEVLSALSGVLVVRVENDFESSIYWGYSNQFDSLAEGEATPFYNATLKKHNNGTTTVTWRREKEYSERDVKSILDEINKKMSLNINYMVKNATAINNDTLILKLESLLHPDRIKELQDDLQSQCPTLKVVILPYSVNIAEESQ